jgi:hypothetical protein
MPLTQMPIELIALDLDGTTVSHDVKISMRVMNAVKAAMNKGIRVTVATGRNVPSSRSFVERLGVNTPVICGQGGMIYDYSTETMLHQVHLPHDIACDVLSFAANDERFHTIAYAEHRIFTNRPISNFLESLTGYDLEVVADLCETLSTLDSDKILLAMRDKIFTADVLRELSAFVGDRANTVQSHAVFVEVNPLDAHKGAALERLAGMLGISREKVLAIGDNGNDKTMIEWAGVGVAMGNAIDEVKAVANWIAPTVEDDGAAAAIEKFAFV